MRCRERSATPLSFLATYFVALAPHVLFHATKNMLYVRFRTEAGLVAHIESK